MTNAEQNYRKRENRKNAKERELQKLPLVENWATRVLSEYELALTGKIYGDDRFAPGFEIQTSPIAWINCQTACTASGTIYRLGAPSEAYIEFRKQNGLGMVPNRTFYLSTPY